MTKTNFDKLVRWDADYYNSLSDNECIICLTDKQLYLIGQITDSLRWYNTRWIGDKSGMDFNTIAEELEFRISETMTCQKLTQLSEQMNFLQIAVSNLTNTVNNYVDPAPDPAPITDDTNIDQAYPPSDLSSHGTTIDGCDTDDKDALYSAINSVVRYIDGVNRQLLADLGQGLGNIVEQSQTLLGAFPATDLLAADDVAKYINFLIDELKEEYEATVDEDLLQATVCDLFCIAVSNGCNTNMYDISNYFGGKVDPSFATMAITFAQLVQFSVLGTFSGDMYFYFISYFQLAGVALGQAAGFQTLRAYDLQIAAGQNSPDNDWTLFCIDCPEFMRYYTYDLTLGLPDGATVDSGTFTADGLEGVSNGTDKGLQIRIPTVNTRRLRGFELYVHREGSESSPTHDFIAFRRNTTVGVPTSPVGSVSGGVGNGDIINCRYFNPADTVAAVEYMITAGVSGILSSDIIRLSKVVIYWTPASFLIGSVATELTDICV